MVKRQTYILAITAILAFACIPALCQEPNSAESNKIVLKYETGEPNQMYRLPQESRRSGSKALRPTHMAEMFMNHISGLPNRHGRRSNRIRTLLETAAGQTFSDEQFRFLNKTFEWWTIYERKEGSPEGYGMCINLYAVSEEDAKKMAEAVVELLDKQARGRREELKSKILAHEGNIPKRKEKLKKQQEEQEELGGWIMKRDKEGTRNLSKLGMEFYAAKEAKRTFLEMDKLLITLQIEISGVRARLEAISKYIEKDAVGANALVKLEQIQCEQTIELAGALARKKTAIEIRTRENEFYHRCERWCLLKTSIPDLRTSLQFSESQLEKAKNKRDSTDPALDPLKVFENKAVIYPVEIKQ